MMLLDLQGTGYHLYDPEIAATVPQDSNEDETYFCAGNLATVAITSFFEQHRYSDYCKLLGLPSECMDAST